MAGEESRKNEFGVSPGVERVPRCLGNCDDDLVRGLIGGERKSVCRANALKSEVQMSETTQERNDAKAKRRKSEKAK